MVLEPSDSRYLSRRKTASDDSFTEPLRDPGWACTLRARPRLGVHFAVPKS